MAKIQYVKIPKDPRGISGELGTLIEKKIVIAVEDNDFVVIGRWGTNRTTLRKLLKM